MTDYFLMIKRKRSSCCFIERQTFSTEVRIGRSRADLRGNMFGGGTHEVMAYIAGRQGAKKYSN